MKAHYTKRTPAGTRPGQKPQNTSAQPGQGQKGTGIPSCLPKAALLWGIAPDHPAMVPLRAAGRLGLVLRSVAPQELDATVGALCGIPGTAAGFIAPASGQNTPNGPAPTAPLPQGPALVLCGLPEAEREALLAGLRAAGAAIPLKAIVTPTNQSWTFAALLAELAREHAALHGALG